MIDRRKRHQLPAVLLCGVMALAGCGESAPRLAALDVSRLIQRVDEIRLHARAGDREGALTSVAALRRSIEQLAANGSLDARDAEVLRRRLAGVKRDLEATPESRRTAPRTATPAPAAPSAVDEDVRDEHDKPEGGKDEKERRKPEGGKDEKREDEHGD